MTLFPKYNLLACNRRNKIVMSNLVPHEECVFVSSDIAGAEPTILLNYSDDATLYEILYTYKKKPAEYRGETLMTSNMYITSLSTTKFMKDSIRKAEGVLGASFVDAWNANADKAKEALGSSYDFAKMQALALIYGLSPSGVVRQFGDAGIVVTKEFGKDFYDNFWRVLPQAAKFRDRTIRLFEKANSKKMAVCNPLGTPLPSQKPRDSMNRIIQSSVSSFIRLLCYLIFTKNKPEFHLRLVCIIHDELIVEVCKEDVEKYRAHLKACVDEANSIIGFKYPLSLGFKLVNDFYAK